MTDPAKIAARLDELERVLKRCGAEGGIGCDLIAIARAALKSCSPLSGPFTVAERANLTIELAAALSKLAEGR